MDRLAVGMIGYGAVAHIHALVLNASAQAELTAVVGPRRERAERFAAAHGNPPVFEDLEAALAKARLDAVIIASPTELHPAHAQAAVQAGLHALVEFPLHAPADEVRRLLAVAEQAGCVLTLAHTSRFIWSFRRVKQLIESGSLGRCKAVSCLRLINRPPGTGAAGTRRSWNDDVLLHHSAHVLDLCQYWFGRDLTPVGVVCPAEASGRRSCSFVLRGPGPLPIAATLTYEATYPRLRVTLAMERGVIDVDGFARLTVDGSENTTDRPATDHDAYVEGIAHQDAAFLHAARGERPFPVTGEETVCLAEILAHVAALAVA